MLENKKLFLFDIDGTLALGDNLFDGAVDLLKYIESIDGRSMYITNNSTKSRKSYVEKFRKWNIDCNEDNFVTASYATCLYLKSEYPEKKIFLLGTESFRQELLDFGIDVVTKAQSDVDCVLVGFDNELNYQKLVDACEILQGDRQVAFLGTNPDLRCPYTFGFIPDCGAITKMLTLTVNREPLFIGKPHKRIVDICLEKLGFSKDETLVVGDRMYTDILCGINAGVDTCLVLTGEASRESLSDFNYSPNYVFEDVKELYNKIKGDKNGF